MVFAATIVFLAEMFGIQVPGERIRKAVEDHIFAVSGASRQEMIVEIRGRLPNVYVASANCDVRIVHTGSNTFKGHLSLPVEIVSGGKVEAKMAVAVFIRTFGPVMMTNRQLQLHQAIGFADVSLCQAETTTLPDDYITSPEMTDGKRTVRLVAANTVVCRSMIEQIPIVKQGDPVTIVVSVRNASVKVLGNARQDGCMGDRIAVQRSGSHERFFAKVVSPGVVEMTADEHATTLQ